MNVAMTNIYFFYIHSVPGSWQAAALLSNASLVVAVERDCSDVVFQNCSTHETVFFYSSSEPILNVLLNKWVSYDMETSRFV